MIKKVKACSISFSLFTRPAIHPKGQSLVELSLTLTLLLVLLAGAFDLGSAFIDYIALRDAAQEGALYGSIDENPILVDKNTNIVQRIQKSSTKPLNMILFSGDCNLDSGICIDYFGKDGNPTIKPCSGDTLVIRVNYRYHLVMPYIGAFIGSQFISLHATVDNVILAPMCE
jgi:hypothetical protein